MRAAFLLAAAVLAAASAIPAQAQDAARGAALAAERSCGACHGAQGRSEMENIPSLAGQQADFITLQMILFREKLRDVPPMNAAAEGLDDAQIQDLAAHFAALPSAPDPDRTARDAALIEQGGRLSAARNCNACHNPDYSGRANVPRVNHQREDYLAQSLREYRDGTRVGADTQMNGLTYGLSNADIRALAHYLAHAS